MLLVLAEIVLLIILGTAFGMLFRLDEEYKASQPKPKHKFLIDEDPNPHYSYLDKMDGLK